MAQTSCSFQQNSIKFDISFLRVCLWWPFPLFCSLWVSRLLLNFIASYNSLPIFLIVFYRILDESLQKSLLRFLTLHKNTRVHDGKGWGVRGLVEEHERFIGNWVHTRHSVLLERTCLVLYVKPVDHNRAMLCGMASLNWWTPSWLYILLDLLAVEKVSVLYTEVWSFN